MNNQSAHRITQDSPPGTPTQSSKVPFRSVKKSEKNVNSQGYTIHASRTSSHRIRRPISHSIRRGHHLIQSSQPSELPQLSSKRDNQKHLSSPDMNTKKSKLTLSTSKDI